MPTGKVKWFSVSKGYGFITPDDGGTELFLHLKKVQEANLPTLESGTALQYSVGSRNGKIFAEKLSVLPKPLSRFPKSEPDTDISDFEKEWGLRRT